MLGPTVCCWCPYFTSGLDNQQGSCYSGKDRAAHGNLTILEFYLKSAAEFEQQHGYRLLDYLDVHYYPAADGVTFSCDESDANVTNNRLQAARALFDPSYVDPSWIDQAIALIPRMQAWVDAHYPGTKLAVSEYNFGGDDCITSTLAHSEVLAVFASYGVSLSTRWSKPKAGAMVIDAYSIFLNYDGRGASILSADANVSTSALATTTSDIETATTYAFSTSDSKQLFVFMFNKARSGSELMVQLEGGLYTTDGAIQLYGIDEGKGVHYVGTVDDKPSSNTFAVQMPAWTVRLAVISASSL